MTNETLNGTGAGQVSKEHDSNKEIKDYYLRAGSWIWAAFVLTNTGTSTNWKSVSKSKKW